MINSSSDNLTPAQGKAQESRSEPHPRDGHLRIPNEIAEALARLKMSGSQANILWAVLRKTLGWQKPGEWRNQPYPISLTELNQATGVSRSSCLRDIENLTRRHVLSRQERRGKAPLLSLNLDVSSWGGVKTDTSVKTATSSKTDTGGVAKLTPVLVAKLTPPTDRKSYVSKETLNKPKETLVVIFNFWNSQEIIRHKKLTEDIKRAIKTGVDTYSQEEICQAIRNYAEILKDESYYFNYRWTLKDFLKRGVDKFLNLDIARANYRKDKLAIKGELHKEQPGPRGKPFEQYQKEQEELGRG